ncbi:MAG TPA: glycosyltransferase 87 family protein [Candidatus Limnocylindrales bacterium]
MQSGRYWARLGLVAVELSLVLLVIVLLIALARQMLTMSYLVMGHDTDYYLGVGREVVAGLVPYRDFSFEYPPLALAPIVLPVALASMFGTQLDSVAYVLVLALENVAIVGATGLCLAWLARRGWSARSPRATFLVYLGLVCATPILFWRFDALPALLTVLALCAVAARRPVATGLAIAAGALTKLYPVVLLPVVLLRPLMARSWREAAQLTLATIVPVIATLGLLYVFVGSGVSGFLGYQSTRGVQLESVPSSVALVAHALWGTPVTAFQGFGSWQLDSPFLDQVGWLWPVTAAVMLLALAVAAAATYRRDLREHGAVRPASQVAVVAAAIVVTLLAYRVLSPQYVVWLLPFAALLPRRKLTLTLAICALTLYIFPFGYEGLVHFTTDAIVALALRNALLLVLFVSLVAPGLSIAWRSIGRRTGRSPADRALAAGYGANAYPVVSARGVPDAARARHRTRAGCALHRPGSERPAAVPDQAAAARRPLTLGEDEPYFIAVASSVCAPAHCLSNGTEDRVPETVSESPILMWLPSGLASPSASAT